MLNKQLCLILLLFAVVPVLSGCQAIMEALIESAFATDDDDDDVVVVEHVHHVEPPKPTLERSHRGESDNFR